MDSCYLSLHGQRELDLPKRHWGRGLMEGGGPGHLGGSLHSSCGGDVEAPLPKAEHCFIAALLSLHNVGVNLLRSRAQRVQGTV